MTNNPALEAMLLKEIRSRLEEGEVTAIFPVDELYAALATPADAGATEPVKCRRHGDEFHVSCEECHQVYDVNKLLSTEPTAEPQPTDALRALEEILLRVDPPVDAIGACHQVKAIAEKVLAGGVPDYPALATVKPDKLDEPPRSGDGSQSKGNATSNESP